MKAITYSQYGGTEVLNYAETPQPTPGDDEILMRVHAASINAADNYMMRGEPFLLRLDAGLTKPKNPVLGSDVAGTVEAIGVNVTQWRVGDRVFGDLSGAGRGAYAEYATAPANLVARIPEGVSSEEAAAVPLAAVTAWQGIAKAGGLREGQTVLVTGASGGVGSYAVQLAKAMGATVTGVCRGSKTEFVQSLGAAEVIDYTKEDFAQRTAHYDMHIDCAAYRPFWDVRSALKPDGVYVMVGGSLAAIFQAMLLGGWMTRGSERRVISYVAQPNADDLQQVADYLASGQVKAPIDRCFPLEETADAMRYFNGDALRGKVVISVS